MNIAERVVDAILDGVYNECLPIKTGKATVNEQIACSRAAANFIGAFDPTGVLSIAGTYLRPIC